MKSYQISLIAILTSLGVTLRLLKHVFVGPLQFINFPLIVTLVAGYIGGKIVGLLVGLLSFFISDLFLSVGPWTIYNSIVSALLGVTWSLIRRINDRIFLFIIAYLSAFVYDIITSILFYLTFLNCHLFEAFILAIVGLFLPIMGGYIYCIGPITELSTATLVVLLIRSLERIKFVRR